MGTLYMQYPQQLEPQDAYVEFDLEGGECSYSYNPEIGNAVPAKVWHGQTIRLSVNPEADTDALDRLLESEEWLTLLQEVRGDYDEQWDGSNYTAKVGEQGEAALAQMETMLADLPTIPVWSADDWLSGVTSYDPKTGLTSIEGVVVTPDNLDTLIAKNPSVQEGGDGVVRIDGIEEYLERLATDNQAILDEQADEDEDEDE